MRDVAAFAPVNAHGGVFEGERTTLIGMTLEAGLFVVESLINHPRPACGAPGRSVGPVRIVAVRAGHESFVDPVLERHVELRPHVLVAGIAEVHLAFREERLGRLRFVDRMAVGADNVCPGVFGSPNVGARKSIRVAGQAAINNLTGLFLRKGKDLGLVAARLDVFFRRAVAALTTFLMRFERIVDGAFEMGVTEEVCRDIRMAGAARLISDKSLFRRGLGVRAP
jgi:hypothetical protein